MRVRAGLSSAFAAVLATGLEKRADRRFQTAEKRVRAGLSSAFAAVLKRGLQKRAQRRFQTGDEMASTLYACLVDGGSNMNAREKMVYLSRLIPSPYKPETVNSKP
ncbi:hypothetical protein T484DRAFT_1807312 [Baffinella frigidus]|nr:hypothetical protein T484DRAFT_1807312 [Cryptophyta sp. CCMP2293]